ncbi:MULTISPECIES: peptidoglycan-binding domain-containing protein [unclassified Streptomyces]|uniref:peptidoglycan-binding domain-containing protein n=1 Tax=unclassified Streptomyces TaxID=2593676 RepID=UPI002E148EA0|nr:peptidoglycan-binding protein [Streptomyces sp. NBC_01205]
MSHHSDESAGVPDDRLLVRPYVAPSGPPIRSTAPAWPDAGPVSDPFGAPGGRHADPGRAPGAEPLDAGGGAGGAGVTSFAVAAGGAAANGARAARRDRGGRLPLAVLALLALGAAGSLVWLLSGPDPRPDRAVVRPDLSVPVLPARPGAGSDGDEPSPERSVRASALPAAAPASSAGTSPAASPKPTPPPSASAGPPSAPSGTLRMGDRGPEVSALQQRLQGQGFTYVSVTGVYDSQTKRGVAQLQRDRDIKGDQPGVYGPATQAAFGS